MRIFQEASSQGDGSLNGEYDLIRNFTKAATGATDLLNLDDTRVLALLGDRPTIKWAIRFSAKVIPGED